MHRPMDAGDEGGDEGLVENSEQHGGGGQYDNFKSNFYRARAVRRLIIQSFSNLI